MTNSNGNYTSGTIITVADEYNFDTHQVEFTVSENAQEIARFDESEHAQAVAFAEDIAQYGDTVIDRVPGWVHLDIRNRAAFEKWADDLAEEMGGGFMITENGVEPWDGSFEN